MNGREKKKKRRAGGVQDKGGRGAHCPFGIPVLYGLSKTQLDRLYCLTPPMEGGVYGGVHAGLNTHS
jgi:hypothetical protein